MPVKTKVPSTVRTNRLFRIHHSGLSINKVSIKTDSNFSGPIYLERDLRVPIEYGLLPASGVVDVENGKGHAWILNFNESPINLPIIKIASCHIIKEDYSKEITTEPVQSSNSFSTEKLTEEQISKFNFGPKVSPAQKKS